MLLLIFPLLEYLLKIWLDDQYTSEIMSLTKVFLIISWVSGISHILIAFFEGTKKIKFNSILETYLIIPFIFILTFTVFQFKNLIFISFILLAKELILIFFRAKKIKHTINNFIHISVNIFLVVINLIISVYYNTYFYLSYLILVLINVLIYSLFKKK